MKNSLNFLYIFSICMGIQLISLAHAQMSDECNKLIQSYSEKCQNTKADEPRFAECMKRLQEMGKVCGTVPKEDQKEREEMTNQAIRQFSPKCQEQMRRMCPQLFGKSDGISASEYKVCFETHQTKLKKHCAP